MNSDSPPLKDTTENTRGGGQPPRVWMAWLWWLEGFTERMFILFCIYTLSIGPMYWRWMDARHVHGLTILAAFYEPLRILGEVFPAFGQWLNWYISWWVL